MISDFRTEHNIPHTISCPVLGVSQPWFYNWHKTKPTGRELRRPQLEEAILSIFEKFGGAYGSPEIFFELVRKAWRVLVHTVAQVLVELGLAGRKHLSAAQRVRIQEPDRTRRVQDPSVAVDAAEVDLGECVVRPPHRPETVEI